MGLSISRKVYFIRSKKCLLCTLFLLAVGLALFRYGGGFQHFDGVPLLAAGPDKASYIKTGSIESTKTILAWTTKSGKSKWLPNTLKNLGCKIHNCKVSEDRSIYAEADAIILHAKDINEDDLPPTLEESDSRTSKKWVLLNHEPPPQTLRHTFSFLASQIDWTISYRRDSTIFAPIYELRSKTENDTRWKLNTKVDDKRKLATWLVSHCKTSSNREGFVAELKRYLTIDVWGKCGKKLPSCPQKSRLACYNGLRNKYKFYLSLENSLCEDYITEKVFLALQAGMIPIVFGGAELKSFLPSKSYINALSFNNVRSLAKHIERVAKNPKIYNSYFEWREKFVIVERRYKWLCDVCEKLDVDETKNTKIDLIDWWFAKSKCKRWKNGSLIDYDN